MCAKAEDLAPCDPLNFKLYLALSPPSLLALGNPLHYGHPRVLGPSSGLHPMEPNFRVRASPPVPVLGGVEMEGAVYFRVETPPQEAQVLYHLTHSNSPFLC